MCIKTYNSSSSSSPSSSMTQKTKPLNPSAQEWRPTKPPLPHPYHFLPRLPFVPNSPPQTATLELTFYPTSFPFPTYQGFTDLPGSSCPQTHQPQSVYYHPVAHFPSPEMPLPGGVPEVEGLKTHPVGRKKFIPPRFRRATFSSSVEKKPMGSRRAWRSRSLAAASSPSDQEISPSSKTTVMIKNIPNYLRRDFMLEFLDGYCRLYSLEYDFMYLPMDFRRLDNLGYAFVNFTSCEAAQKFKDILQNYKWNTFQINGGKLISSNKICEIKWARIQGKEKLVKRFKNSTFACDKLGFLPVILDPPRNGSDPAPGPPMVLGKTSGRGIRSTR